MEVSRGGSRDAGLSRLPGGLGGPNWGGTASDPASGYVFVATQDVGALGFVRKAREGAAVAYEKATPGRATFDVPIGDQSWPCQKPPWGSLIAVNMRLATSRGGYRSASRNNCLPVNKTPAVLCWPVPSRLPGGVLFIASTDDNRFRAFDSRTGKELWTTTAGA